MKTKFWKSSVIVMGVFFLLLGTLEAARGGGGGGGRGAGGGGGRGGGDRGNLGGGNRAGYSGRNQGNISRSPTMSRYNTPSTVRSNTPSTVRSSYDRPQTLDYNRTQQALKKPQLLESSQLQQRVSTSSSSQLRQQVGGSQNVATKQQMQQFVQNSKAGQNVGTGLAANQRFANLDQSALNNIKQTLPGKINTQNDLAQRVRQNIAQDNPNRNDWFNRNFWNDHNYHPYYGYGSGWGYSTWPAVNTWLAWDTTTPYYYESGYPLPVDQSTTYLQSEISSSPQQQYNSTANSNENQQTTQSPQSSDWLPLGVFALVNNTTNPSDATMFFQLVLGKDGTIAGSYYNKTTDQIYPLDGIVDKATQQAVWKMSVGEGAPIFQTGIYNLTNTQTSVEVNFNDSSSQDWLMVRLQ